MTQPIIVLRYFPMKCVSTGCSHTPECFTTLAQSFNGHSGKVKPQLHIITLCVKHNLKNIASY